MKKLTALILGLVMALSLVACSSEPSVELNFPKEMLELGGVAADDLKKDPIVKNFKENEDGSVTFSVSAKDHKELVDEMKKTLDEGFKQITGMEGMEYVKKITMGDDLKSATVEVDKAAYEALEMDQAAYAVGVAITPIQYYLGSEDGKCTVIVKDAADGTELNTLSFPEALEDVNLG